MFFFNSNFVSCLQPQLAYEGFQYSKPADEMNKYMRVGRHSMNLGGVPINISVDLSTQTQLCGDAFIHFQADSSKYSCSKCLSNSRFSTLRATSCTFFNP